jgi:hypothetical protein
MWLKISLPTTVPTPMYTHINTHTHTHNVPAGGDDHVIEDLTAHHRTHADVTIVDDQPYGWVGGWVG